MRKSAPLVLLVGLILAVFGARPHLRAQPAAIGRFLGVERWVGTVNVELTWDDRASSEVEYGTVTVHHVSKYDVHVELDRVETGDVYQWRGRCRGTGSIDAWYHQHTVSPMPGSGPRDERVSAQAAGTTDCSDSGSLWMHPETEPNTYDFTLPSMQFALSIRSAVTEDGKTETSEMPSEQPIFVPIPARLQAPGELLCCGKEPLGSGLVLSATHRFEYEPDERAPMLALGKEQLHRFGGGTKKIVAIVSWHLAPAGRSTMDAIIRPAPDYENWLPQAGEDEDTAGNYAEFDIVLQDRDKPNSAPPVPAKSFTVELTDVSREKGVCLNWPRRAGVQTDGTSVKPDLKLESPYEELRVTADGQKATCEDDGRDPIRVRVNSFDWGAFGRLKVTVTLADDTTIVAHLAGEGGKDSVAVPKDDNDNHIADAWERSNAATADAESDEDEQPQGDGTTGDAISLYEEYRGFQIQGQHVRTDPHVKDVWVRSANGLDVSLFHRSELATHALSRAELGPDDVASANKLVANLNRGFATLGPVYVLLLLDSSADGAYGFCDSAIQRPSVPRDVIEVIVDRAQIAKDYGLGTFKDTGNSQDEILRFVAAHELSHGSNVWHHGDVDYFVDELVGPTGKTARGRFHVAAAEGQESGVEQCLMRYGFADLREVPRGRGKFARPDGSTGRGEPYGPYQPVGRLFCDTNAGTGVNAADRPGGPLIGPAGRGNCRSQFCVNTAKPCGWQGGGT